MRRTSLGIVLAAGLLAAPARAADVHIGINIGVPPPPPPVVVEAPPPLLVVPRTPVYYAPALDRKSTRLNSSHTVISYAVFCLKKKKTVLTPPVTPRTIA